MEKKYIQDKEGAQILPITHISAVRDDAGNTLDSILANDEQALINESNRAKAAENDRYTKSETYNKTELNNLITTPNQQYVTVTATDQTTAVTDVLPSTGAADTVYRVGNWDGSQYDTTCYTEYAWNGSTYAKLSTKEVGIDDEPTAGSDNLVKSGGVAKSISEKTGIYENSVDVTAETTFYCYINHAFKSGDKIKTYVTGTAGIVDGSIKLRDHDGTTLKSLSINGNAETVTLTADTEELYTIVNQANVSAGGTFELHIISGNALQTEDNTADIAALTSDVKANKFVLNISSLFPDGGTDGTDVYTKVNARGKVTVASGLRKQGLILTYKTTEGWVIEEFIGDTWSTSEESGKWKDLVNSGSFHTLSKANVETKADVRNKIPFANRQIGAIVAYKDGDKWCWDMFIGDNTTTQWGNSSYIYWKDVYPSANGTNDIDCSLTSEQELDANGISVTGNVGERDAIYTTDLISDGIYSLSFKFKYPKSVNQVLGTTQLAKLNYLGANAIGGFCIDIFHARPTTQEPFAQPYYGGGLDFYPVESKTNNYATRYRPSGMPNKQFVGKDAISIRYLGDVTETANQDVVLTLDDNGLTIKHSTNSSVILHEDFPQDGLMNTFATNLLAKTSSGGAYEGIIDFDYILVEGYSTDDLLRVSNIPLVGDYSAQSASKGWQAFPCFLSYFDDEWHSINIRYNANKTTFREAFIFLYDGMELSNASTSPTLEGDGKFNAKFTLGGDGILVKDFNFKSYKTKIDEPKIIVCMAHDQSDGVYNPATQNNHITIGRMQWIMDTFSKYGFDFVGLDKIASYINGNLDKSQIPEKCYTVIFDDKYYLEDWTNNLSNKFRNLLMRYNAKASFAIAPNAISTDDKVAAINKDKSIFLFHAHDHTTPTAENFGYSDFMSHFTSLLLEHRNKIGATNIYTYSGGLYDPNVLHLLASLGICYCSCVGNNTYRIVKANGTDYITRQTNTFTSKAYNVLSQPRLSIDDDKLTEEKLHSILGYLDSIS